MRHEDLLQRLATLEARIERLEREAQSLDSRTASLVRVGPSCESSIDIDELTKRLEQGIVRSRRIRKHP